MGAWTEEDVRDTINGLFQMQAKLEDIAEELSVIRRLLEEDDGRGDEEEG